MYIYLLKHTYIYVNKMFGFMDFTSWEILIL